MIRRALFLFLVGCTGSNASDAGADALAETAITCQLDPMAETYTAGMKKNGSAFTFVLVSSDPTPPARGNNKWSVRIEKNGQPQTGAMIEVTSFMPKHGHGSSVAPTIMPSGDAYTIDPIYLFMPGLWQITIKATVGMATDSAVFTFCIEG